MYNGNGNRTDCHTLVRVCGLIKNCHGNTTSEVFGTAATSTSPGTSTTPPATTSNHAVLLTDAQQSSFHESCLLPQPHARPPLLLSHPSLLSVTATVAPARLGLVTTIAIIVAATATPLSLSLGGRRRRRWILFLFLFLLLLLLLPRLSLG